MTDPLTSAANRLLERAHIAAGRIAELEHTLLSAIDPDPWVSDWNTALQSVPQLREQAHRDSLRSLAQTALGGPDRSGCISDFLRNHWYLYADLKPRHRVHIAGLLRRVTIWATGSETLLEPLDALLARVDGAFSAFTALERLDTMEDFTGENIERYWDASALADAYFTIDWASFGREELFDATGRRASEWLVEHGFAAQGLCVLQIGCGAGRIERFLSVECGQVIGVDISQQMVALATQRLVGLENTRILKSDGRTLPVDSGTVDTVFSFLVFIHIHDPDVIAELLAEAFRVLAPRGRFIVTMASYSSRLEKLAADTGFVIAESRRIEDRRINSFDFFWDWIWVFERPDDRATASAVR